MGQIRNCLKKGGQKIIEKRNVFSNTAALGLDLQNTTNCSFSFFEPLASNNQIKKHSATN